MIFMTVGSQAPTPCPGGKYCQFSGLDTPTDNCSAGYYCTAMATTATPTDGSTGNVCPPGFYCLAGSAYPTPCSPGTYSPTQGNTLASHCLPCDFGEYCAEHNLTVTTGIVVLKFQEHIFILFSHKKIIWISYNACTLYLNFNGYFL